MPDYVFTVSDELPRTATEQWEANLAAIRTVKDIEAEGRSATPEEQAILARYSGFGNSAFGQAFANRPTNQAWAKRGRELRSLVTPEEYESIRGSRLNAFYTTSDVINSMWSSLHDMGAGQLESPVVLEPSAGAGRFLGLQPPEMARKSQRIAVELDSLTGNIARHAYPDTQVHVAGYEQVHIPDNYVDIAISNVPFGNYPVYDEEYADKDHMTRSIHNYFFGKTVDKLKPGGVAAFITTHHTLDSPQARPFREELGPTSRLPGRGAPAQRHLPDTEVVTDIIYLRKRAPGETQPVDRSWVDTAMVELPTDYEPVNRYSNQTIGIKPQEYSVNQYFLNNPDKVLGIQDGTGTMRGPNQYNVRTPKGADPLAERVEDATEDIGAAAPQMRTREVSAEPAVEVKLKRERDAERAARPAEGQYRVSRRRNRTSPRRRVATGCNVNKASEGRIRGMLGLRDEVRTLMEMEMSGDVEEEAVSSSAGSGPSKSYADFVGQYGRPKRPGSNVAAMAGDPDAHFLRGLEVFRNEEWQEADVFQAEGLQPGSRIHRHISHRGHGRFPEREGTGGRGLYRPNAGAAQEPGRAAVGVGRPDIPEPRNPPVRASQPVPFRHSSGKAGLCQGSRRAEPGLPGQHRGPGAGATGANTHRRRLPVHEQLLAAGRHDERGFGPRPLRRQPVPPGALPPGWPAGQAGGLQPRDGHLGADNGHGGAQVRPERPNGERGTCRRKR